jgi:hypothetical protein
LDVSKSESDVLTDISKIKISALSPSQIEDVVNRQYFDASAEIIRRAHEEEEDVSVPIRNAVGNIRSKLDHLVKLLDPEFSRPQKVPPAFQWAQNDTAVFIQLKYSRRFNAPGAVDVEDFNCTFTNSSLVFSAIGGHSGKRFEYALNLDFFDSINPELSSWNIGSVGKVFLTIMKQSVSKWPRLLLTNVKIDNMHYWYDFGDQMESSLKPLPVISESPLTCLSFRALFCPTSGKCTSTCDDCKSKPKIVPGACVGPPAYKPKDVTFTDTNGDDGLVSGALEISTVKEYHRYDVSGFNIYLTQIGVNLTSESSPLATSGSIQNTTVKVEVSQVELAEGVSYEWIIVPFNSLGENRDKLFRKAVIDLHRPDNCSSISPLSFEDTDGEEGSLKGLFTFTSTKNPDTATHLVFYWGVSDTSKLSGFPSIAEVSVYLSSHNLTSKTPIPPTATHVLVYAKSSVGESSSQPVGAWTIEDRQLPKGLVTDLRALSDMRVEFTRIADEADITGYTVRSEWRKKGRVMTSEVEVISTAGFFTFTKSVQSTNNADAPSEYDEGSWQLCVYLTNKLGPAKEGTCVNTSRKSEL